MWAVTTQRASPTESEFTPLVQPRTLSPESAFIVELLTEDVNMYPGSGFLLLKQAANRCKSGASSLSP